VRAFRRRLLIVLALALVAAGAWGARAAFRAEPVRFTAQFESTVGLYPGSDVEVLGVPVGKVTKVEPVGESVRVSMELDPGTDVAADTAAVIIAPTLVSDRFVQLTKPWSGGDGAKLRSGAKLGLDRTAVPVEIDDLYSGLQQMAEALGPRGANKNGALSDLLEVAAKNLDGQGKGINKMIREFGEASSTLSGIDEDFFETLANLDQLNTMLVQNDEAVGEVNRQFADVAGYLAADRDDLGKAAKNLGDAMAVVDDFIRNNRKHLQSSVRKLGPTTRLLKKQRKSLMEAVRLMPLALHDFLDAYDADNNVLVGRGDLNEATLWSTDGLTARSSSDAPPTLIPSGGGTEGADQ
jgi:virulence factor Mce-like protein